MMEVNDNTTLRNLQQMVDEWIKTYGVRYFNELTNMACLTEEVGENWHASLHANTANRASKRAKSLIWARKWLIFCGY